MITEGILALTAALLPADSAMCHLAEPAYRNPAVKQWMMPRSHSAIGPSYSLTDYNRPVDPQLGTGERCWTIGADTYLKHRSSTLWGDASYLNGKQHDIIWNETSDPSLVYPYLTADSVGGDMKMERYRFAGGYADQRGRLAWGAQLSYTAGLYYRNVDPRPRNVTGLLDLSAGIAYRITGPYFAGISVGYSKYKQSCDIDFKSQLGVEKIYHLTGLGTQYQRFAGVGDSYYYNGNRFNLSANLYPASGSGLVLTANLSRFTFDKVLTSLNKLPLNHAWDNSMQLQAAWMHRGRRNDFGISAEFDVSRRHGFENIFGDASSGVYPKIASLDMYADNRRAISLTGLWQYHCPSGLYLSVKGRAEMTHRAEAYASPRRRIASDRSGGSLEMLFSMPAGAWRMTTGAGIEISCPTASEVRLTDAESQQPQGLIALERYKARYLDRTSSFCNARIGLQRTLTSRLGLAFGCRYERGRYGYSTHSDAVTASLAVIF